MLNLPASAGTHRAWVHFPGPRLAKAKYRVSTSPGDYVDRKWDR